MLREWIRGPVLDSHLYTAGRSAGRSTDLTSGSSRRAASAISTGPMRIRPTGRTSSAG